MSGYLLDTHSFLWSVFDPEKLSRPVYAELASNSSLIYISSVTFWEISLKAGIGKLTLTNCQPDELPDISEIVWDICHCLWRRMRLPASTDCRDALTKILSTGC